MLCFDPGEEFVLLNKLLMEYIASDRLLFRLELWKLTYRYMLICCIPSLLGGNSNPIP